MTTESDFQTMRQRLCDSGVMTRWHDFDADTMRLELTATVGGVRLRTEALICYRGLSDAVYGCRKMHALQRLAVTMRRLSEAVVARECEGK